MDELSITIGEAISLIEADTITLDAIDYDDNQYLYIYRDGDVVFYVGQSSQPFERLMQHLGKSKQQLAFPDSVGVLVKENLPVSLTWKVDIFSIQAIHNRQKETKISIDGMEQALIAQYNPCLNVMYNRNPTKLPARYIKNDDIIEPLF